MEELYQEELDVAEEYHELDDHEEEDQELYHQEELDDDEEYQELDDQTELDHVPEDQFDELIRLEELPGVEETGHEMVELLLK